MTAEEDGGDCLLTTFIAVLQELLVETPLEVTEKTDNPEPDTQRRTNIDVAWMLEHARQVYRLLPGTRTDV